MHACERELWGAASGDDGRAFQEPFKFDSRALAVKKHNMFIHYSEKCMEERRERQKITTAFSMHSFEGAHFFVKDAIAVEFYRREHYEGSNASTGIGPVSFTPDCDAWTKKFSTKKEIYGTQKSDMWSWACQYGLASRPK